MYKFVWKSFSKEKWKSLQESKLSGGEGGKGKKEKKKQVLKWILRLTIRLVTGHD